MYSFPFIILLSWLSSTHWIGLEFWTHSLLSGRRQRFLEFLNRSSFGLHRLIYYAVLDAKPRGPMLLSLYEHIKLPVREGEGNYSCIKHSVNVFSKYFIFPKRKSSTARVDRFWLHQLELVLDRYFIWGTFVQRLIHGTSVEYYSFNFGLFHVT